MALISLGSLAAAIFLGFFRKMNTGLVCIGFALLLGKLAGIPDKEIIGGFNYSLFLMLLGVTYLFGLAEWNGTLKLLTKKITVLAGKRTYLIPVVMYLFATVLSALGPGTIPTTAIMMVFGMTLAVEMKINPAMLAAIIFLGAAGGGMSPLAATGIIGLNLCEEFGLTGIEAPLLVNGVFSSTVYAAVVYIAFGGYKLKSEKALKFSDTASFNRAQIITLLGICAMVGMVMIFKVNVGLASFTAAMALSFFRVSDEGEALKDSLGDAPPDLRCRGTDECDYRPRRYPSSFRFPCVHHECCHGYCHPRCHRRRHVMVLFHVGRSDAHTYSHSAPYHSPDEHIRESGGMGHRD